MLITIIHVSAFALSILVKASLVAAFQPIVQTSRFRNLIHRIDIGTTLQAENKRSLDCMERLDLTSKFSRWKFLQDILEEDEDIDPRDVNEVLFHVLKSFYDFPRPIETPEGKKNPSPNLTEEQRSLLVDDLFQTSNDESDGGKEVECIQIFPMQGEEPDETHLKTLSLLEKLQPDPLENEEDFKSCWDIVVELYGRESTKAAQQRGGNSWDIRSSVVRLLLHYDFLVDEFLVKRR